MGEGVGACETIVPQRIVSRTTTRGNARHEDNVKHEKNDEPAVIALADARVEPNAVMIKAKDAAITRGTVLAARRAGRRARTAIGAVLSDVHHVVKREDVHELRRVLARDCPRVAE